ncbi:MAG: hypothetical protein AB3N14_18450, partial [Flavobacteriaceae bacterium]
GLSDSSIHNPASAANDCQAIGSVYQPARSLPYKRLEPIGQTVPIGPAINDEQLVSLQAIDSKRAIGPYRNCESKPIGYSRNVLTYRSKHPVSRSNHWVKQWVYRKREKASRPH